MATNSQTLLFIPDISGFTKFVNATEIEHSKHIISELLELLINNDKLGLKVAEIEGDAVFFYKKGVPPFNKIVGQVQTMFLKFHNHLKRYEKERICRCGACKTAEKLSLKFVVHSGNVESLKIKGFEKLHGTDVILVHRLLKNDIEEKEYALFTNAVLNGKPSFSADYKWMELKEGFAKYDNLDKIAYKYSGLGSLHKKVEVGKDIKFPSLGDNKITCKLSINAPMDGIFENFTNLEKRKGWNDTINDVVYHDGNKGAGSIHTCIIGKNSIDIETLGRIEHQDTIIYGERVEKFKGLKDFVSIFTFEEKGGITELTASIDFNTSSLAKKILKPLVKYGVKKQVMSNLYKLKKVSEEV